MLHFRTRNAGLLAVALIALPQFAFPALADLAPRPPTASPVTVTAASGATSGEASVAVGEGLVFRLPGSAGTCTPASAGTDPRGECGDGGACDLACGAGSTCESRAGIPCTAGGCTADGQSQIAAAVCVSGQRDCPVAVTSCTDGYRCDADAGACLADCRSRADCAPGYACDPSHRCVQASDSAGGTAPSCASARSLGALPAGAGLAAALACGGVLVSRTRRRARRKT